MNKNIATKEFIDNAILDLRIAFKENDEQFWDLLIERMMSNSFKEDELDGLVESVIDQVGRTLYIADVIQRILDKRAPIID